MTTFNDREKGFESKFAHDEEMQFKAQRAAQQAARPLGGGAPRQDRRRTPTPTRWRWCAPTSSRSGTRTSSASSPPISTTAPTSTTIRAKMTELLGLAKAQLMEERPRA